MSDSNNAVNGSPLKLNVSLQAPDAATWDALLALQDKPSPFFCHSYLVALETSQSAVARTGWQRVWMRLERGSTLVAATVLYIKSHSYGEYVFDHAWANAYAEHGLNYYPKALVATPFTPVPCSRLLAIDAAHRQALVQALVGWCGRQGLSSLHLLFLSDADQAACEAAGLMLRQSVQFHWQNQGYADFEAFLTQLAQDKRKKIRAERRKVELAGVSWRVREGAAISANDWALFYRCYEQTYAEHGNPPYLTPAFFEAMRSTQAQAWVLFIAQLEGRDIATSLIATDRLNTLAKPSIGPENCTPTKPGIMPKTRAYGRYWGALERVDCLHFEACYYQPLQWCIANQIDVFEGGAQGEHKLARGLLGVGAHSAHWLSHPAFSKAVEQFLAREGLGMNHYMTELESRGPFKPTPTAP